MAEILRYTPLWVFALFIGLVLLGLQQARTRTVKPVVVILLPAGMLGLSWAGLVSSFGVHMGDVALWFCGLSLVTVIGIYAFSPAKARYDSANNRFTVPGSWWPLLFIMLLFFIKYAVGVSASIRPELLARDSVILTLSLLYGGLSGAFLARALRIYLVRRIEC